jgi:hypothetical protein
MPVHRSDDLRGDVLLELRDRPQLVGLGLEALELLLLGAQTLDEVALRLPRRLHRRGLLLEVADLALEILEALLRALVAFALHRRLLDLEGHDAILRSSVSMSAWLGRSRSPS